MAVRRQKKSGTKNKNRPERLLFARLGWMKYYFGPQKADERPIGGGKYNKQKIGFEVYNFKSFSGHMHCFHYCRRNSKRWTDLGILFHVG